MQNAYWLVCKQILVKECEIYKYFVIFQVVVYKTVQWFDYTIVISEQVAEKQCYFKACLGLSRHAFPIENNDQDKLLRMTPITHK